MKLTLPLYDRFFDNGVTEVLISAGEVSRQNAHKSFLQLFNNYVQELFNYGMHVCADEDTVKFCIQIFFLHVKNNEMSSSTHPTKNKLYKQFRDTLSREMSRTKRAPLIPFVSSVPSNLDRLKTEVTFLRIRCGFSYDEISAIMAIKRESVYNSIHQTIIKANEKKDNILGNE